MSRKELTTIEKLANEREQAAQRLATCRSNAESAKQAASLAAEKRSRLESELANQLSEPAEVQLAALRRMIEAEAEHTALSKMADSRVTRAATARKAADEALRAAEADASEALVWDLGSTLAAEMAPFAARFEVFEAAVADLRRYGRTVTFLPNLAPLFAWVAEFQKASAARRNPRPLQKADPRGQVVFLKGADVGSHGYFNKGEIAGFNHDVAATLVLEGYARWPESHPDQAGLLDKARTWLTTLRRPVPSTYYGSDRQARGIDA